MRSFPIYFLVYICNLYLSLSLKECENDEDISHAVESERLPDSVTPTYYALSFVFDRDLTSYKATSTIEVVAMESTKVIVLHADKFSVDSVDVSVLRTFKMQDGLKIPITETCYLKSAQFLVIKLEKYLKLSDMFNISFTISGSLTSEHKGISAYTYLTKEKTTKKVVATQFRDIMARTVFPCFDEPGFKARFDLEVTVPLPYQVVSNNLIRSKLIHDTFVTYKFLQTPIMTTYSLGFVIYDYAKISTLSKREVMITLWIPDSYIDQGKFGLNLAPKILDKYESLLKVNYPFKKLDIVCIPGFHDRVKAFWGMIIFDSEQLLVDEHLTGFKRRQRIVSNLGFSIAYQWFGFLVTPKWWNDIWLSSGLTSLVFQYAFEEIYREYRCSDIIHEGKLVAMQIDQLKFTHAVSTKDLHRGKYVHINDEITYFKGAAIPYMKLKLLEPDHFFRFLATYLNNFAQSTATTYQFLATLQMEESYDKIYDVGIHWIKTAGFPIVSIAKVVGKGVYEISQERIIYTDDETQKSEASKQLWQIPIKYVIDSPSAKVSFSILATKKDQIKVSSRQKILKININSDDYYVTQYHTEMLEEITRILKDNIHAFSLKDKMTMLYDAFTLLAYGKYDVMTAFEHFEFLRYEYDFHILRIFFSYLNDISTYIVTDEKSMKKFKRYLIEFTEPIINDFDWENSGVEYETQTYVLAILYSVIYGDDKVTDRASKIYENYLVGNVNLNPDIATGFMCGYVRKHGKAGFEKILNQFLSVDDYPEKESYLFPLVCSNDTDSLDMLIKMVLTDSVRLEHKLPLLSVYQYSGIGYKMVMDFIYNSFEDLQKIFKETPYALTSVFPQVYRNLNTEEQLKTFYQFIERHKIPDDIYIQTTIEMIKKGISWTEKNLIEFIKYIA